MEIRRYLRILRRWWWLLLAATLVASVASYMATRSMPRTYRARARVMVGQSIRNPNPDWMSINIAQQLALTYAELATTREVLEDAVGTLEELGLQASPDILRGMFTVKLVQGTQLLDITVVDIDPIRAAAVANAVGDALVRQGPGGTGSEEAKLRERVKKQIDELQANMDFAKGQIQSLEAAILKEDSARAIAELKNQRDLLQQQINQWQATYAQLYAAWEGNQANILSIVERAEPNYSPVGPRTKTNVLLAGTIGALLAVGAILLLEYLDDTVKTGEELSALTDLPFLGIIPRMHTTEESGSLVTVKQPRSNASECFRVLRTNLQFSSLDRPLRTLLVTSPQPTEGKSTTVANLGVVMAQAGRRVVVMDSDLRRPVLHHIFDLPNDWGLTGMLFGDGTRNSDGLLVTAVDNLRFIPSGPLPPNPSEIIGSQRMEVLVNRVKEAADLLILDSPPVLTVADATILAARVDGVVLVADCGVSRRDAVRKAAEALRQVGANLLGTVLNRVNVRSDGYYYYYYYYRSHYDSAEEGMKARRRRKRRRRERPKEQVAQE